MDDIDNSILKEVNDYYTIYPKLKNTNIKYHNHTKKQQILQEKIDSKP